MKADGCENLLKELMSLYDGVDFHQQKLKDREGYEKSIHDMAEQEAWSVAVEELRKSRKFLDSRRPRVREILSKLQERTALSTSKSDSLATDVLWGTCRIDGDLNFSFPWKYELPFTSSFCGEERKTYAFVRDIILSTIIRSAHGTVRLIALDTHNLGAGVRELRPILYKDDVLTHVKQVDEAFNALTYRIADFYEAAGSSFHNWAEYKRNTPQDKSPYIIMLVLNAQALFQESSSSTRVAMEKIMRQGPAAGITTFLLYQKEDCTPKQLEDFKAFLIKSRVRQLLQAPKFFQNWKSRNLRLQWEINKIYPEASIPQVVEKAAQRMGIALPVIESLWSYAVADEEKELGLSIPMGWSAADGRPAILRLDDTTPHCFIGGQTGSGKSNLLHVILHSLLVQYSEDELHLYVLDFKQGVEMKLYADAKPASVQCVATQSDVEFAVSLLNHLLQENKRRIDLFPSDVNNISKYNRRATKKLPRIVLLVDECQHLFQQGSYRDSTGISKLTEQLVRQGRSQGIHLILCTQTLAGLDIGNKSLWNNIPARVALFCKASDSAAILAPDNPAAAHIQSPGQAVLNLQNGNKDANIIVNVPKLQPDMDIFSAHLHSLSSTDHQVNFYDGISHYPLPSPQEYARQADSSSLLLGCQIDYNCTPFQLPLFDTSFESCTAMAVTWGTPDMRKAMRTTIMRSAAVSSSLGKVYYISKGTTPEFLPQGIIFVPVSELSDEKMTEIFNPASESRQKLVYIQDWDLIHALELPTGIVIRPSEKNSPSPFKNALEAVEDYSYVHIIAEVKSPGNSSLRTPLKQFRSYMVQGISPKDGASFIGLELGNLLPQVGTDEQHINNVVYSNRGNISVFHGFTSAPKI